MEVRFYGITNHETMIRIFSFRLWPVLPPENSSHYINWMRLGITILVVARRTSILVMSPRVVYHFEQTLIFKLNLRRHYNLHFACGYSQRCFMKWSSRLSIKVWDSLEAHSKAGSVGHWQWVRFDSTLKTNNTRINLLIIDWCPISYRLYF